MMAASLALLDELIDDIRCTPSPHRAAGEQAHVHLGDSVLPCSSSIPLLAAFYVRPSAGEISDSADDAQDKGELAVWKRVDCVLREFCLGPLAKVAARKWVREMADPKNVVLKRLREWLLLRVNGNDRASPLSAWQLGCPEIIGGLRAEPIWDTGTLQWLRTFEENASAIREELLALRQGRGFQPLKIPNWASKNRLASPDGAGSLSHVTGDWNVFYLHLHEVPFEDNCARCPITSSLLKALPRSYKHAFFSALTPGTHILKHHGPTNKKLRVHLPLIGTEGATFRVADRVVTYTREMEGRPIVFDDSFEHEAWHRGKSTRIVLVFDVWHPDLSDREVQFLSCLQRARMRAEMAAELKTRPVEQEKTTQGAVSKQPQIGVGENFYQLLHSAKDILPDNRWWV